MAMDRTYATAVGGRGFGRTIILDGSKATGCVAAAAGEMKTLPFGVRLSASL